MPVELAARDQVGEGQLVERGGAAVSGNSAARFPAESTDPVGHWCAGVRMTAPASLYPGVTVLLARTILHERFTVAQRAGLGLCTLAIIAIAMNLIET